MVMTDNPETTSESSNKEKEALQERKRAKEDDLDDLPPDYTSVVQHSAASTSRHRPVLLPSSSRSKNLNNLKPSNFVHVSRNNWSIRDVWIIDPSKVVPSSSLPPLRHGQTEEMRENLFLETTNGMVEAEVFVLPSSISKAKDDVRKSVFPTWGSKASASSRPQPEPVVTLRAHTRNGPVRMKIHDGPPELPDTTPNSTTNSATNATRPAIHVDCFTANGNIHIHIPRSFRGPVSVTTRNGQVQLSDAVKPLMTNILGFKKYFIGDADAAWWKWKNGGESEWNGDLLKAETANGNIKISFDDEVGESGFSSTSSQSKSKSRGGLLGKIFGGF